MKQKDSIYFQMEISKELDEALKKIVNQFPNKPSKKFIAAVLLEDAIKRNDTITLTNKGK
jgi:hypothetical protein